jgi:uncharacterized protein (DUF2236 family)
VTRAELELRLDGLRRSCASSTAGIFGPDSEIWRINRYTAAFLGGGRAALLQVAHPQVAQAIAHHSNTRTDPYGRFQRTFRQVFPMVWGSLDQALAAARQVSAVHGRIHGTFEEAVGPYERGDRYDANDRAAVKWVHATLWETSIRMHELLLGEIAAEAKERYYLETRRFAALFGLSDDELPASWPDFVEYNEQMWESPHLAVGAAGREIAGYLFDSPNPMARAGLRRLRDLAAALLPERLRSAFELPWGEREQRSAAASIRRLRLLLPRLPPRLRYVPPYFEARRRLAGHDSPDRLGQLLSRLYLGRA